MARFDASRRFLSRTLLLNDRLKVYRKYIETAKENGYYVCSMKEFYDDRHGTAKHFVLRHDVDDLIPTTKKMFMIEKSMGVHSTYYFRWSTVDRGLIEEMLAEGFDVGLHYESIATYAKEHDVERKEDLPINEIQGMLKSEVEKFKVEYSPAMTSICSHGDRENIRLGISNNTLLEGTDPKDFGIEFEAYDRNLYEQFGIYHIMDGNLLDNFGFSYRSNPIDGIAGGKTNILFLSHPIHWHSSPMTYLSNMVRFLLGRATYTTEREFKRIAG